MDHTKAAIAPSDVARLAHWTPASPLDAHVPKNQYAQSISLRDESLSAGPLAVLATNVETFARKLVNEVVLRNLETNGTQTVTAANVRSVLRPYASAIGMPTMTPMGIVRVAQQTTKCDGTTSLLPTPENIDELIAEERKTAKSYHQKLLKTADQKKAEKKEKRKQKRQPSAPPSGAVAVA
jgi:hypothetical protein